MSAEIPPICPGCKEDDRTHTLGGGRGFYTGCLNCNRYGPSRETEAESIAAFESGQRDKNFESIGWKEWMRERFLEAWPEENGWPDRGLTPETDEEC